MPWLPAVRSSRGLHDRSTAAAAIGGSQHGSASAGLPASHRRRNGSGQHLNKHVLKPGGHARVSRPASVSMGNANSRAASASAGRMRVVVTDSGLGGLSVAAALECALDLSGDHPDIEILYLNAAPSESIRYDLMPTREEKVDTFNRFLVACQEKFAPQYLFIACNTLGKLYADTPFAATSPFPVETIVATGVKLVQSKLAKDPDATVLVFGTMTTISEKTYQSQLGEGPKFAYQACPRLPDAIVNDSSGEQARVMLKEFIPSALAQLQSKPKHAYALMACTHYGYQAGVFTEVLAEHGVGCTILDPNPRAVAAIMAPMQRKKPAGDVKVRFLTRYPIPQAKVDACLVYLHEDATRTRAALSQFEHHPDLFPHDGKPNV